MTFSPLWDNIIKDTARTEQEYPAAPPDREERRRLKALCGQEREKTAPAAGPETGAVPFPQQKARGRPVFHRPLKMGGTTEAGAFVPLPGGKRLFVPPLILYKGAL